ncbi:MAG: hypothetical protein ACLRQF_01745 [Thomasclavelia ramosa]
MEIEKWLNDVLEKKNKRAMPIITFPAATKLNISVKKLINDTDHKLQLLR